MLSANRNRAKEETTNSIRYFSIHLDTMLRFDDAENKFVCIFLFFFF